MGDASPSELKKLSGERKPDILIAPYAYANTASSWSRSLSIGAEKIIILHLPDEKKDEYGIRNAVKDTVKDDTRCSVLNIGERIKLC